MRYNHAINANAAQSNRECNDNVNRNVAVGERYRVTMPVCIMINLTDFSADTVD